MNLPHQIAVTHNSRNTFCKIERTSAGEIPEIQATLEEPVDLGGKKFVSFIHFDGKFWDASQITFEDSGGIPVSRLPEEVKHQVLTELNTKYIPTQSESSSV